MAGVVEWRNPVNKFFVSRVHYTADPAKCQDAWRAESKAGMPDRGWRREMEIDFSSPEGEPVIPEFEVGIHVTPFEVLRNTRLVRGWDPGFVSPAVVIGQNSPFGQLRILAEVCPFNTPLEQLVKMVKATTLELTTDAKQVFDAGDPASLANTDLGNVHAILQKAGIFLHTTRPGTESSYQRLRERFTKSVFIPNLGHQQTIVIHPRCKTLIAALSGAFHLSPHPPYNPIKVHPYKDVTDSLRYLNDNLDIAEMDYRVQMTKMSKIDWAWT